MRTTTAPRWWEVYDNVRRVLEWMVDQDAYNKADLHAAMEKPWHYDAEARKAGIYWEDES
jgi:hypothetical protein